MTAAAGAPPPRGLQARSLAVSLATTAIDAGLFAVCTLVFCGLALVWARWVCGAVGAACNFSLNRVWAFRHSARRALVPQLGRYGVTALVSVSVATLVWLLLRSLTGLDPRLLHLVSLGLVWLTFSFPMLRRWVFRSAAPAPPRG